MTQGTKAPRAGFSGGERMELSLSFNGLEMGGSLQKP